MKAIIFLLILTFLGSSQRQPEEFNIDLDSEPQFRYKEVAKLKSAHINKFIDYLYTTEKYKIAFKTAKTLSFLLSSFVGREFYLECKGIAEVVKRNVYEIVVYNYMYELGAYNDFCTSIPVQASKNDYFMIRNLDYGYQEYLAENSIKLTYFRRGVPLFQTIGHAGLIGAHTGLRFNGYSATLNERIEGGLHKTLLEIFLHRAETVPYLLQKTFRECEVLEQAERKLASSPLSSPVYYILNSPGRNIIIERSRHGANAIYENKSYMVQTNTDRELADPDGRRTVAESKMRKLWINKEVSRANVWQILTEKPNMNNLTLITVLLDTINNVINATVWF